MIFILQTNLISQNETVKLDSGNSKLKINADSLKKNEEKSSSGIDTTITYKANDTSTYFFKTKTMRINGQAKVDYKTQNLEAEIIEVNFNTSMMDAKTGLDSNNKKFGFPKFKEQGTEYYGEKIRYNIKTNKGLISQGETKLGDAFYYGSDIKRVSKSELFVKDGYYTTCDAPKPHYYFGSNKMKIVAQDRIFLDPLIFYVEDLPIFELPFGLYFPTQSGRRSGLVVPTFAFSGSRGVVFENLGFYWAASDYFDTQIGSNIYSKGGYLLKNSSRWKYGDDISGNVAFSFGKTRFSTDDYFTNQWSLLLNHSHKITPQQYYNLNLNFTAQDYYRNTTTNLNDRRQQSARSSGGYNLSFDNGQSINASYQRDQNIINNSYSQSFTGAWSIPQMNLGRFLGLGQDFKLFDKDVTIQINPRLNYSNQNQINTDTSINKNKFIYDEQKSLNYSPSITFYTPKLFNVINLTPSIGMQANSYFRSLNKVYNPTTNKYEESYKNGFFTEYWLNASVSASTRIFGVIDDNKPFLMFLKPSWIGVKAIRHTLEPSISYNYSPDSKNNTNFYGTYYDTLTKQNQLYSRFQNEGGSHAPTVQNQSISFNLLNKFEYKVAQKDTIDKNVELANIGLSGSYNFMADSIKMSDISVNFRTPALNFLNFSSNATFTPYDYDKDTATNSNSYHKVNRFLFNEKKGIARLTNFSMSMGFNISSQGIQNNNTTNNMMNPPAKPKDSVSIGERFKLRQEQQDNFDLFSEEDYGYLPYRFPWTLNINMNFSYSESTPSFASISRNFNLQIGSTIDITPSWKLKADGFIDVVNMKLQSATFNLTKDMHCWDLRLTWNPAVSAASFPSFYLRFGIKASQLQDLKIEKQNSQLY